VEFLKQHGIQLLHFGIAGNKEPFVDIPDEVIRDALVALLGTACEPILLLSYPPRRPQSSHFDPL